jgi:SGNH domain (fused to AT3 domains)
MALLCLLTVVVTLKVATPAAAETVGLKTVLSLVNEAPKIKALPSNLQPSLQGLEQDNGQYWASRQGCYPVPPSQYFTLPPRCTFGDKTSRDVIVLDGDSHAAMWINALDRYGQQAHKKVILLWLGNCGVASYSFVKYWSYSANTGNWDCQPWQDWVLRQVRELQPETLVLSSNIFPGMEDPHKTVSPDKWSRGMSLSLANFKKAAPHSSIVVLGGTPFFEQSLPSCLAFHKTDVRVCSSRRDRTLYRTLSAADSRAALSSGARYVDVAPWFCSTVCTSVVGNMALYSEGKHITSTYATFLTDVLIAAIFNPVKK